MEKQYEELLNIVLDKKEEFEKRYQVQPHFVKFPMFWTRILKEYQDEHLHDTWNIIYGNTEYDNRTYFYGLEICETPTILEMKDIEVF